MRLALSLAIAIVASCSRPALAWDPFWDDFDPGFVSPPDPAPFVVPEGIYLVTDVYAGDVVSTHGDTTTYAAETVHETPGTYARVVDVVGSGSTSAFDGASFNGRASLPDGRPVGGTYYEDFILASGGYVSVNIVFFQDDSATRASVAATPPPPPAPTPAPAPSAVPAITPPPVSRPAATPTPERDEPTPPPAPRIATAGIALAQSGPVLAAIEVLRGRQVQLWPRAFLDGQAVAVRSWHLAAGQIDITSRRDGSAADPCDAIWVNMPAAGGTYTVRFEVTSDAAPGRAIAATIVVAVRSPALGE